MPAGEDWSAFEVRRVVEDYMSMLEFELTRQPYNKTAHRKALRSELSGRSNGSVELKHQNISAVLRHLGHFWIPGYKPRGNYQRRLEREIVGWLIAHPDFDSKALAAADAPAAVPDAPDFSRFEVAKPEVDYADRIEEAPEPYDTDRPAVARRDYVTREARNVSLGRAGELLALQFEQVRLARAGHERLAGKVTHVAAKDDRAGFDILSFEPSGKERFIEVKTTAFAKETPFFASAKEVNFARHFASQFQLYRLFQFKSAPRCFVLSGALHEHCRLETDTYRCSFR